MNDQAIEILAKVRELKIKQWKDFGEFAVPYANRFVIDLGNEFKKNAELYGEDEALRSLTEYHEDCERAAQQVAA